jgi:hypothetical protein
MLLFSKEFFMKKKLFLMMSFLVGVSSLCASREGKIFLLPSEAVIRATLVNSSLRCVDDKAHLAEILADKKMTEKELMRILIKSYSTTAHYIGKAFMDMVPLEMEIASKLLDISAEV